MVNILHHVQKSQSFFFSPENLLSINEDLLNNTMGSAEPSSGCELDSEGNGHHCFTLSLQHHSCVLLSYLRGGGAQ